MGGYMIDDPPSSFSVVHDVAVRAGRAVVVLYDIKGFEEAMLPSQEAKLLRTMLSRLRRAETKP
jgi:hypothetical protein